VSNAELALYLSQLFLLVCVFFNFRLFVLIRLMVILLEAAILPLEDGVAYLVGVLEPVGTHPLHLLLEALIVLVTVR
jgi:hypothetical protein